MTACRPPFCKARLPPSSPHGSSKAATLQHMARTVGLHNLQVNHTDHVCLLQASFPVVMEVRGEDILGAALFADEQHLLAAIVSTFSLQSCSAICLRSNDGHMANALSLCGTARHVVLVNLPETVTKSAALRRQACGVSLSCAGRGAGRAGAPGGHHRPQPASALGLRHVSPVRLPKHPTSMLRMDVTNVTV